MRPRPLGAQGLGPPSARGWAPGLPPGASSRCCSRSYSSNPRLWRDARAVRALLPRERTQAWGLHPPHPPWGDGPPGSAAGTGKALGGCGTQTQVQGSQPEVLPRLNSSLLGTGANAHTHKCTQENTHTCTPKHARTCTGAHTHANTCTHMQTHTRKHAPTHTHTHSERDLLTNSLRASRTLPEPVSWKICTAYSLEGLRPPTVALGVLVVSMTSCSGSPGWGERVSLEEPAPPTPAQGAGPHARSGNSASLR